MANALIIGWNKAVVGREAQAQELFQSSLAFWGKQAKQGNIESFEPVFFQSHGGDMNGFIFIKGDPQKLDAIQHTDDYINLVLQAGLCLEGSGFIRGYHGQRLMDMMQRWGKLIPTS